MRPGADCAARSREPQRAQAFARDLGLARPHPGAEALAGDVDVDLFCMEAMWTHFVPDFLYGIPDLAAAVGESRPPRLTAEFSVHVNEVALTIHEAGERGANHEIVSHSEPLAPMPWAD